MFNNLKELVVVLGIAGAIFFFAKPIVLRFMTPQDFTRRRFIWFLLTFVAFVSPDIWLYALVAVPAVIWSSRKDSNPIALYLLLLHVAPPADVIIPVLGNNGLFPLNNFRLLALCILIPVMLRHRREQKNGTALSSFGAMDIMLLASGALGVALYVPPDLPNHVIIPDSPSNVLRRAVLFLIDTYAIYYAVSRTCQTRERLVDAAAAFCLSSAVMAAVAMFEYVRGWLLYANLASIWSGLPVFYLTRNGSVRAQASAGHALALGFLLAVASGLWLYLKSRGPGRLQRIGVTLLFWGGLLATFSRGPWLGAVVAYFAFNAARPRALLRVLKGTAVAMVAVGVVAVSPIGDRIISVLPVMGRTADANIIYRLKLADRGWQIVMAHPFFGDQYPYPQMEDLRQGEGIIDIVNTYLGVALDSGLTGLFFFVGFIAIALIKVYSRVRALAQSDPDLALLGAGIIACIASALVMIQSCSFILAPRAIFYVLAGLAAAYTQLNRPLQQQVGAISTSRVVRE